MGTVLLFAPDNLFVDSSHKMPKGGGRSVSGSGTNSSNNSYVNYSSGSGKAAGYSYSNSNGSSYYNTGSGHGFSTSPAAGTQSSGGQAYGTHYNYNAGTSASKGK